MPQPIHDLKCEKCDYTTYQANALIRHRLHYHAPIIGKCTYPGCKNEELMTKAKLSIHIKRHRRSIQRPKRGTPCEFCGLVLSSPSNLKRHLMSCKDKELTNGDMTSIQVGTVNIKDENEEASSEDQESNVKNMNGAIKLMNQRVMKFKVVDIKALCKYCGKRFSKFDLEDHIESCPSRKESPTHEPSNPDTNELPQATTVTYKPEAETMSEDNSLTNDGASTNIHIKLEPEVVIREENQVETFEHPEDNLNLDKDQEESDDPLTNSGDGGFSTDESDMPFKCKKCDYRTEKKKYLQKHMMSKHDPNPIKCPDCDKLVSRASYNKHRQTHIREFECNMCQKNFATK